MGLVDGRYLQWGDSRYKQRPTPLSPVGFQEVESCDGIKQPNVCQLLLTPVHPPGAAEYSLLTIC